MIQNTRLAEVARTSTGEWDTRCQFGPRRMHAPYLTQRAVSSTVTLPSAYMHRRIS